MTTEEAINAYKRLKSIFGLLASEQVDLLQYLDMGIEALEKQIPKKVVHMGDFDHCPDCRERGWRWIAGSADNYCPSCGQRLDWSDAEWPS